MCWRFIVYNTQDECETDCGACAQSSRDPRRRNICADCVYSACISTFFLQRAPRAECPRTAANPCSRRSNSCSNNTRATSSNYCAHHSKSCSRNADAAAIGGAATNHPPPYTQDFAHRSTAVNYTYSRPQFCAVARRSVVHSDNRRQVARLRTASRWNRAVLGKQIGRAHV